MVAQWRALPVVGYRGGGVGEVWRTMEFLYDVIGGQNAHWQRPIDEGNVGRHRRCRSTLLMKEGGKLNVDRDSGSIGTMSSHGVRVGGCAPVLCSGRGEGAVEMAVDGELMTVTRLERAERHLDWKRRRK
jgi:hypothetical protein